MATVHPLQLEHVRVRHLVSAWDCEGGDDDGDDDDGDQHGQKDIDDPDVKHIRLKSHCFRENKWQTTTTSY